MLISASIAYICLYYHIYELRYACISFYLLILACTCACVCLYKHTQTQTDGRMEDGHTDNFTKSERVLPSNASDEF